MHILHMNILLIIFCQCVFWLSIWVNTTVYIKLAITLIGNVLMQSFHGVIYLWGYYKHAKFIHDLFPLSLLCSLDQCSSVPQTQEGFLFCSAAIDRMFWSF